MFSERSRWYCIHKTGAVLFLKYEKSSENENKDLDFQSTDETQNSVGHTE